jgi:hypothetical protein
MTTRPPGLSRDRVRDVIVIASASRSGSSLFAEWRLIKVRPYWPRDRYLELAPKYSRATRARLDPHELERELGLITVPPPIAPSAKK